MPEQDTTALESRQSAPEPTIEIVRRIRAGDAAAREALIRRYLPVLRRWARGRLPSSARDVSDTDDLVQVTLLRTLNNLGKLRLEHPGSFFLYLKQTVLNGVRDEIRRNRRKHEQGMAGDLPAEDAADPSASVEDLHSDVEAYERALRRLPKRQQRLLVMRLEFGLSYDEIAAECGSTADAARMMVSRAVMQLAKATQEPPEIS